MTVPVIFQFYAPARGGAKEAPSRASLDSPRPEEGSSGLLCVLAVENYRIPSKRIFIKIVEQTMR